MQQDEDHKEVFLGKTASNEGNKTNKNTLRAVKNKTRSNPGLVAGFCGCFLAVSLFACASKLQQNKNDMGIGLAVRFEVEQVNKRPPPAFEDQSDQMDAIVRDQEGENRNQEMQLEENPKSEIQQKQQPSSPATTKTTKATTKAATAAATAKQTSETPTKTSKPKTKPVKMGIEGWTEERADKIIRKYLKHRRQNMTRLDITKKIFKVDLNNVEHCYPFVCPNMFKAFADVVVEDDNVTSKKQPSQMNPRDLVFVRTDSMFHFAECLFPTIKVPFLLVTTHTDTLMPRRDEKILSVLNSPLLLKWFAISPNVDFAGHRNLAPIPLGVKRRGMMEELDKFLINNYESLPPVHNVPTKGKPQNATQRPTLVYVNLHATGHRSFRLEYFRAFRSMGARLAPRRKPQQYYRDLAKSKFVLAPRGVQFDTFRFMESVLMGAVPIVEGTNPMLNQWVYGQAPSYTLKSTWRSNYPTESEMRNFRPSPARGRAIAMADFWFDVLDAARGERRRRP